MPPQSSIARKEANGGELPAISYPPLPVTAAPAETIERPYGSQVQRVTYEHGLVRRVAYLKDGVTMQMTENEWVGSIDLKPPAELLEAFAKSEAMRHP